MCLMVNKSALTAFSKGFFLKKMDVIWFKYQWVLFLRVELGNTSIVSDYLHQCWPRFLTQWVIYQAQLWHVCINQCPSLAGGIFSALQEGLTHHSQELTHVPLNKMAAILHRTFSDAFSLMNHFVFWLKIHWSLFLRSQLTITQCWFR